MANDPKTDDSCPRDGDAPQEQVAQHVRRTWTPRVLGAADGLGTWLYQLDYPRGILQKEYKSPILVSAAGGVGAKLEVALRMGVSDTIGIDLVASCVNRLVAQGAEPLFFQESVTRGPADGDRSELLLQGISAGCREAGCAWLGGQSTELPGLLLEGKYALAGFAVGVLENSRRILPKQLTGEDEILGLAASGLHISGFTLIRRIFLEGRRARLAERPPGLRRSLGEELLAPSRIYARPVLAVLQRYRRKQVVHGLTLVAAGGLLEAVARLLPSHFDVILQKGAWPVPPVFRLIQEAGDLSEEEMFGAFNQGIGMTMAVSPYFTDSILRQLSDLGVDAWRIGRVVKGRKRVMVR